MVELSQAKIVDYFRFVFSAILLIISGVATGYAIVEQKTNFWKAVPGWAAIILFIFCLLCLGVVEGLQIALVELKRQHPTTYKESHPRAFLLGQSASKGDNVERFLMGRQVFVVFLVFFAAKLTTIQGGVYFFFPIPSWVSSVFLETGLLACIVVVIIAQLMPQIVAAKYPVHFLQLLVMKPAYYACILLEMTGITHICWILSELMSWMFNMKDDVVPVSPLGDKVASDTLRKVAKSLESVESGIGCSSSNIDTVSQIVEKSVSTKDLRQSGVSALVQTLNEQVNPDGLRILRHFLDNHPEKFAKFPSVIGGKIYPAPQTIAEQFIKEGHQVPRFLTNISDPEHIPPHIVACSLLALNQDLQEELDLLRRKCTYM